MYMYLNIHMYAHIHVYLMYTYNFIHIVIHTASCAGHPINQGHMAKAAQSSLLGMRTLMVLLASRSSDITSAAFSCKLCAPATVRELVPLIFLNFRANANSPRISSIFSNTWPSSEHTFSNLAEGGGWMSCAFENNVDETFEALVTSHQVLFRFSMTSSWALLALTELLSPW